MRRTPQTGSRSPSGSLQRRPQRSSASQPTQLSGGQTYSIKALLTVQPPDPPELDSEMAAREIPQPPAKRFEQVAPGMYRYSRTGTFYERPWINGRRTWRSLGTTDLQAAQRELRRRRGPSTEPECGSRPIMKAVLEFNLPEAHERFEASAKGLEWKSVVVELDRQLYSWIKERQHFATPVEAFRILRQQLHQGLAEKGLRLV